MPTPPCSLARSSSLPPSRCSPIWSSNISPRDGLGKNERKRELNANGRQPLLKPADLLCDGDTVHAARKRLWGIPESNLAVAGQESAPDRWLLTPPTFQEEFNHLCARQPLCQCQGGLTVFVLSTRIGTRREQENSRFRVAVHSRKV